MQMVTRTNCKSISLSLLVYTYMTTYIHLTTSCCKMYICCHFLSTTWWHHFVWNLIVTSRPCNYNKSSPKRLLIKKRTHPDFADILLNLWGNNKHHVCNRCDNHYNTINCQHKTMTKPCMQCGSWFHSSTCLSEGFGLGRLAW